ncbi:MAG: TolC family protein, partial [Phycisphaerae bacterium]|nr:TolC family protein [Phycisphaerae bacterium]
AVRAAYETAERALATEVRKQYPDIEIGPSYNTDGNEDFTFGVRFPLPLWNHNQQGVAQADAERELARARFETALELQLADLHAAFVAFEGAARQRNALESEIVPLLDEQASDNRRITELGEVNTLLLLDSVTRQQSARLSLVEARKMERLAHIQITQLVGPAPARTQP